MLRRIRKMAVHCFIDTNIFLRVLGYSKDDLEQLKKLAAALKTQDVILYLSELVCDEYMRNKDAEIQKALDKIKEKRRTEASQEFPNTIQNAPIFAK